MSQTQCTIGVLARLAGVSPDTIRHYERIGLVPREDKTPPCRAVRDLLRRKIVNLDAEIAELKLTRRQLATVLTRWNQRLRRANPKEFVLLLDDLDAVTSRAERRANVHTKWRHQ